MIHIALYEPEIPPNTGNVIRLCANIGAQLHLIEPLGFTMEDKRMRRAGLDYHEFAPVQKHADYTAFLQVIGDRRIFTCSTHGKQRPDQATFQSEDVLLFGPETRGLPVAVRESVPVEQILRLPMRLNSRSLNLSNSVAVLAYEAWRQLDFIGGQ